MLPERALHTQQPAHIPSHQLLILPHSAPQGDAKEGLGRAQAKGEDLAGDASKAAKDAADQLKP